MTVRVVISTDGSGSRVVNIESNNKNAEKAAKDAIAAFLYAAGGIFPKVVFTSKIQI
jgi:hypothetical protein